MNLCIQLQASLTPCARAHALLILFDNCIYLKHPTCSGILRLKNSWMMVGYKKSDCYQLASAMDSDYLHVKTKCIVKVGVQVYKDNELRSYIFEVTQSLLFMLDDLYIPSFFVIVLFVFPPIVLRDLP